MEKEYKEILKKLTILLVDDNIKLRTKIKELLLFYVNNIYEASDGVEAIEIYHKFSPNIIITDVKMPRMDGFTLTSVIRKLNPNIPITIISAYSERTTLLKFISMNLVEYLVKPIESKELTKVLENCTKIVIEKGLIEVKLTSNIFYSYSKKSLLSNSKLITLSPKEVYFLELLIKNRNKLVTKEAIENIVYNGESIGYSAINNLIAKIRKKIKIDIIVTVSTMGFMLIDEQ